MHSLFMLHKLKVVELWILKLRILHQIASDFVLNVDSISTFGSKIKRTGWMG